MGVIGRAKYRVWQFWRSIRKAPFRSEDEAEITEILSVKEMMLFDRQALSDKQHALRVMRELRKSGHTEKELLAAALLHDVGKSNLRMAWWDRPVVVLAEAIVPAHASRWAKTAGSGWSRPFYVKSKHAEWGAEAASGAGSSARTVELIRRHSEPIYTAIEVDHSIEESPTISESERQLALLQWADGIN